MKNKIFYVLFTVVAVCFIAISCEKAELIEPLEEEKQLKEEEKKSKLKCHPHHMAYFKKVMLTKKVWTYGYVYHENAETQELLAGLFKDLTFKFYKNGSYHIVIPSINRDDTGNWEFDSKLRKIIFDKGSETEHFISIKFLGLRHFVYTYDDPQLGPWKLHLIRRYCLN